MKVCFTVDMEQDCPPFLSTFRGIEEGTPPLLRMLDEERVRGTFFITGDIARRFPEVVRQIAAAGHEIGCHGDTHRRFDMMPPEDAEQEIRASTATLRSFYPVRSFRPRIFNSRTRICRCSKPKATNWIHHKASISWRIWWVRGPRLG